MEVRQLKIIFNKSGDGYISGKLSIPMTWLKNMNLTPKDREVKVTYDEETKSFTVEKLNN